MELNCLRGPGGKLAHWRLSQTNAARSDDAHRAAGIVMRTQELLIYYVSDDERRNWGFQRGGYGPLVQRKAKGVSKGGGACVSHFDHDIATLWPSGLGHRPSLGATNGR